MGTRSLVIVCFWRRYYIHHYQFDGDFGGVGAKVVASIPANPEEYQSMPWRNDLSIMMC
jgi:hypothetical protein